jgi:diguanylate cyclase (GGDEF)-like protein/PAS domain S-box-containing protein
MKPAEPLFAGDANEEISALITTLHEAGRRLEKLTAGEVDTVADHDGRAFLLRRPQEQLRYNEAAKQAAILNALPANIALLDRRGVIVSVNEAWRSFAVDNGLHYPGHAVGADYLDLCDRAQGEFSAEAREVASGIRAVLLGGAKSYSLEYPCHSPSEQRWFLMTATPLAGNPPNGAVVMHLDITERRRGEEDLRRFAGGMDAIADAVLLIDRASMRFVHVNDAACRYMGLTREQLLALDPWVAASMPRAELERIYDAAIASGVDPIPQELPFHRKDGASAWVESRRHALRSGDGWIIVTLLRDITERKQAVQKLHDSEARFRSLSMLSSDWFWEQDAEHRFVAFSGGEGVEGWGPDQHKALGLHRWDLGGVMPISCDWEEHKRLLDAHEPFRKFEYSRILGDGRLQYVEASGEPIFDAGGGFTGYRGVATEITERKTAELRIKRLNRVYAVLSGINGLIVRVDEREELFGEACRIAVEKGGFHSAWIGVVDSATQRIVPAASAGADNGLFAAVRDLFSSSDGALQGRTLAAQAIVRKRAFASNDSQNDPAVLLGKIHADFGIRSMAMLPLVVADEGIAVLALYASESNFFDVEEMKLLAELAGNIAFAVHNIEKAGKLTRTTRVNAMLSGINAAIVHHHERNALFREVCRIAVSVGGFALARVIEVDPGGRARIAATSESDAQLFQRIVDAYNSDPLNSRSLLAVALRSEQPVISNDVASDPRIPKRAALTKNGNYALALLPIAVEQRVAGTVILRSREPGMFDEAELRLLREMVANLSFALEHIEKETKVRRLTRVHAVLSGINSLIVRVHERDELFKSACRIAVEQGRFTTSWIGTVDPGAMKLVLVASAGATPDHLALINQRFSHGVDMPPGNTLTARAIREKKAAVSNDVQNDPDVPFKEEHALRGSRSIALLPLQVAGEVVGILALYADEVGFFDDEELKLLNELAGDIAFAMDHLDKQARIDYLAYYDVLTGLANRGLFLERVAQYMRSAASGGHKMAIFLIDLERFKNINDSLGRPAGDALLKQVAAWLTHNAGDASLLARVGADHFALVLPEIRPDGSVTRLLEKTMAAFMEHPFRLEDAVLRIAVKAGVALYPDDGADADTLLRNAEAALKKAKVRGERYLFYEQEMNATAAGRLTMENQLRQALDGNEFVLHYQPKINLESGKLTSCEALIRWNDPRTGLVPPGRFIPVLEETGLIYDVGRWALRQAIEDYLRWRAAGLPAVRIAVNVSPLQLRNRSFIAEVEQRIGIDIHAPAGLELEITESLIMEDVKHSIASLQAIRTLGVTIAIDDFGTGFSSLSYLAKLPVDTLKIDRSFIIDMTTGPEGLALVSTIINLAQSLNLKVVAEGVETNEQSRLLRLLRCDEMQGFLFSKPVPAEIFETQFLSPRAAG